MQHHSFLKDQPLCQYTISDYCNSSETEPLLLLLLMFTTQISSQKLTEICKYQADSPETEPISL